MDFTEKMQRQKMGFREYMEALEEECRKIEHFRRELPLCLELVTQSKYPLLKKPSSVLRFFKGLIFGF